MPNDVRWVTCSKLKNGFGQAFFSAHHTYYDNLFPFLKFGIYVYMGYVYDNAT